MAAGYPVFVVLPAIPLAGMMRRAESWLAWMARCPWARVSEIWWNQRVGTADVFMFRENGFRWVVVAV